MKARIAVLTAAVVAVVVPAALGSVSFSGSPAFTIEAGKYVRLVDFDGDGNLDLLAGTSLFSGGSIQVVSGTGAGTFTTQTVLHTGRADALRSVNANSDLLPDAVSVDRSGKTARVYRNTSSPGAMSFTTEVLPYTGGSAYSVDMGDVNSDGRPDVIVGTDAEAKLALQNGDGTFAAFSDVSASPAWWVALADVTGSPALDLLQITSTGPSPTLRVAPGNGDGTFASPQVLAFSNGGGNAELRDLDGDGDLDVFLPQSNSGATTVVALRNDAGTFAVGPSRSVGVSPYTADFADVDGDGIDDMLVASLNAGPAWVKGTGDAAMFGAAAYLGVGSGWYMAAGDLNGDLRPDAFSLSNSGPAQALLNTSTVSGTVTIGSPFDSTPLGTPVDRTVTLTNDGSSRLRPGSLGFGGDHAADYSVVSSSCTAATLLVGESCTATVRFAPSAAGLRTATVSSPSGLPTPGTVFSGTLSGTGLLGVLSGPASADAGTVRVGTSASTTVTLSNTGDAPLTPATATLVNAPGWSITADGCTGTSLNPAATCAITLSVAPTAEGTATGTLTVPGSAVSVALTAVGEAAPVDDSATPEPEPSTPERSTRPTLRERLRVLGPKVPRVGHRLVARARFQQSSAKRTSVTWLRCSRTGRGCRRVHSGTRYRLTAADRGRRLRFRVVAVGAKRVVRVSPLTPVVRPRRR